MSGVKGIMPSGQELDLHGMTVDDARPKIDEFLNAAFRAGLYTVRIVHGKGAGVLLRAVGSYLSRHPLVKSYGFADRHHGGVGATQVQLSDWWARRRRS